MITIDDMGRAAARTALDQAKRRVDVEAGLAQLRDPSPVVVAAHDHGTSRPGTSSRRWLVIASAAAALVMVIAITAVVRRDGSQRLTPVDPVATVMHAPTDEPIDSEVQVPSTPPQTTELPTTSSVRVEPGSATGLAVSYVDPPPLFEPVPFGAVTGTCDDTADCSGPSNVAVMDGAIVAIDSVGGAAMIVDAQTGDVRTLPLNEVPYAAAAGPGDVLYGLVQGNSIEEFAMKAIALDGGLEGQVIGSQLLSINQYTELPDGAFGHGPNGVIDRLRDVGAQAIGYVDEQGRPTTLSEPSPLYTMVGDTVSSSASDTTWPLEIERAPGSGDLFVGESPPAPTVGGAAVVWTHIGPSVGEGDYPPPTMPVVAWLRPDGSVFWRQLPDGWSVAASDIWGTVLIRQTGLLTEFAWLTPPEGDL